jgi:hypothetical protein
VEATSAEGYSGSVWLYDPSQASVDKVIKAFAGHTETSADFVNADMVGKSAGTTSAITAVKFAQSTGNIASGTFKLYGVS